METLIPTQTPTQMLMQYDKVKCRLNMQGIYPPPRAFSRFILLNDDTQTQYISAEELEQYYHKPVMRDLLRSQNITIIDRRFVLKTFAGVMFD